MKRDWDLLRWLLHEAESCNGGYPTVLTDGAMYCSPHYKLDIGERNFGEVYEHVLLLGDVGFAEVEDLDETSDGPTGAVITRLTMAGHDFLDTSRDESRWNKTKQIVSDKGGAVTVGILIELLSALMKQQFGL